MAAPMFALVYTQVVFTSDLFWDRNPDGSVKRTAPRMLSLHDRYDDALDAMYDQMNWDEYSSSCGTDSDPCYKYDIVLTTPAMACSYRNRCELDRVRAMMFDRGYARGERIEWIDGIPF